MGIRAAEKNVSVAILGGALLATVYSAYAVFVFATGMTASSELGVSLGQILFCYYAAGLLGGTVIGLLQPLGASLLGTIFLGCVGVACFYGSFAVLDHGPFWMWPHSVWKSVALITGILGPWAGILTRRAYRNAMAPL
ncbi:MAG: hypothetical protein JWO05_1887 [Gemmatimonadetes bacterium]|nr:hypothetical protein [Gemmatimonadota bacterium]